MSNDLMAPRGRVENNGSRRMSDATNGGPIAPNHKEPPLLRDYAGKDEIAREFGVSERTIERWVRLRLLPRPVKLGRTTLFHLPTVKKHLARQIEPKRSRRRGI